MCWYELSAISDLLLDSWLFICLVLGFGTEQKQADVNAFLLLLGLLCLMLPLMFRYSFEAGDYAATSVLWLSRASSIFMLVAYVAYLFFQLKTHRQFFESAEVKLSKYYKIIAPQSRYFQKDCTPILILPLPHPGVGRYCTSISRLLLSHYVV